MATMTPFNPHYGSGVALTASAAAGSVTVNRSNKSMLICNGGSNVAFVRICDSTGTNVPATAADMPILGGQRIVIQKASFDVLSYLSPVGTTLYVITGEGGYL